MNVITIGNFDGVHMGHRALLKAAKSSPSGGEAQVVALTFEPHPVSVLRPDQAPARLMTGRQKRQALLDAGADSVVMLEPRRDLLSMEPEEFLRWVLGEFRPGMIVEGPGFRFGRERAGDTRCLKAFGAANGIAVRIVEPVDVTLSDQTVVQVSSSLIRWLLSQGRVADVRCCMGRSYELLGVVVPGDGRGRGMGVPTLNLDGKGGQQCLVPAEGVYAGVGVLRDGKHYPAAISVGRRETFGGGARVTEVHLLGYKGDIYGQEVRVRYGRWVRDQRAFPSAETLRAQLGRDVALTAKWSEGGMLEEIENVDFVPIGAKGDG